VSTEAPRETLDSAWDWVAEHTRGYVETNGQDGQEWHGYPCLVLTTTGRRSGAPRRNALIYGRDGDRYLLVASKGGADHHPLWYRNLETDPAVTLQVGAEIIHGRARTATPEEKARLWPLMTAVFPRYDELQAKTRRKIPLIIVEPEPRAPAAGGAL
jgi:deazaflavin-dependent oxidoreductase (nitroreductase family)